MKLNINPEQALVMFLVCLLTVAFLLGVVAGILLAHIYYKYWILDNFFQVEGLGNLNHKQLTGNPTFGNPIDQNE